MASQGNIGKIFEVTKIDSDSYNYYLMPKPHWFVRSSMVSYVIFTKTHIKKF